MLNKRCAINFIWGFLLLFLLFLLMLAFAFVFSSHQKKQQISEWRIKLHDSLDKMSLYHSDERFFAGVFQTAFSCADKSPNPLKTCKTQIARLKKQFNGRVKFVVINPKGAILSELSDKTGYDYVFKAMHEVITDVFNNLDNRSGDFFENLPTVKKRIKLLRGYFGQFLPERLIALPMLSKRHAAALKASKEPDKALLWYRPYKSFAVIAFADNSLLGLHIGPQMLAKHFNSRSSLNGGIKIGYYTTNDMKLHGVKPLNSELLASIISYTNSALDFAVSKDYLRVFKYLSPDLVAFAQLKANRITDVKKNLTGLTVSTFKWLFLLSFICFCANLKYDIFAFSLRQKILALFALGSLLPIAVALALGFGYFEQKASQIKNNVYKSASGIIKEADNRYSASKEAMAEKFNNLTAAFNQKYGADIWQPNDINAMQSLLAEYKPDFIGFIRQDKKHLITSVKNARTDNVTLYYLNVLNFINNNRLDYKIEPTTLLQELTDEAYLYSTTIENLGKISEKAFGTGQFQVYASLLGDKTKFSCWGILVVGWRFYSLQRAFLSKELNEINKAVAPMQLIATEEKNEAVFPSEYENINSLKNMSYSSFSKKIVKNDNLIIKNSAYIAVSLCSTSLLDTALTVIYPKALIEKQLKSRLYIAALVLSLSLFIMFFVAYFFAERILMPVKELKKGLKAISRGDYSFQCSYFSNDELGRLTQSFNETIKNLGRLSVGTAVQKSLLPSDKFEHKNIEIFARSIFMNKMGGDYFDYYKIDNDLISVFFGDVAGHGIPAAVLTAAAKAAFSSALILNMGNAEKPSTTLNSINEIFVKLREKQCKRMMTALSLVISAETGKYRLAMAGQTYPLIISESGFYYAEAVGTPLGIKKGVKWAEKSGALNSGDIIVLYSDGIIEAHNAKKEVFGFKNFEELVKNSFNKDLKIFYKSIIAGYKKYAASQDDDITLMLIKYEKKNKNGS